MGKFGIIAVNTESKVNIGDYIQGLAPAQFYDDYKFIEREQINTYNGDYVKMIMNGWFMHEPKNWPPSEQINPLFLSFHINILAKDQLLSDKSIAYLKKIEPIGCRDYFTVELLKGKGVEAYFSGCMTLTLGVKYKSLEKDNKCYFVDSYYDPTMNLVAIVKSFIFLLLQFKTISKICINKYKFKNIRNLLRAANFYSVYCTLFTNELLAKAIFVSQQGVSFKKFTNQQLMVEAEKLVENYAKASLVVTSRIHCALPCLAVDTPVLYVENKAQSEASSCRLNGLKQLFNIINCDDNKLQAKFKYKGSNKISLNTIIKNKTEYLKYSRALINSCERFVSMEK